MNHFIKLLNDIYHINHNYFYVVKQYNLKVIIPLIICLICLFIFLVTCFYLRKHPDAPDLIGLGIAFSLFLTIFSMGCYCVKDIVFVKQTINSKVEILDGFDSLIGINKKRILKPSVKAEEPYIVEQAYKKYPYVFVTNNNEVTSNYLAKTTKNQSNKQLHDVVKVKYSKYDHRYELVKYDKIWQLNNLQVQDSKRYLQNKINRTINKLYEK